MRRIFLNLRIALRSLASYKMRTALAMLGVFLGTFSLIVVSNLTDSLTLKGQMEIERLGKNLLMVRSGTVLRFGSATRLLSEATTLTPGDARAILQGSSQVGGVSASSFKSFPVRYGGVSLASILVTGVDSNYPDIRNFKVKEGVFFSGEDNENLARVAVLGKKVVDKLFPEGGALGKHILIFRVPCQVIGIMEEKGVDVSNVDQDNQIFVPLHTFLRRFVNQDYVNNISVQTTHEAGMPAAKAQIEAILRGRHKIKSGQKDDFTVIDSKDVLAMKSQATSMISLLGRVAATVSFVIGAIGILSIMILIVNERRLEIGIRRAVGSRKRDIVLQFLMESSVISLAGGMMGVVIGFGASIATFRFTELPFSISPAGLFVSFAASVAVGILAGVYPSRKATTIQPVDIIRS